MIDESVANKIYDILVSIGDANESERNDFIYTHLNECCEEWRFCGHLGFGGKYRSNTNTVDCYTEDETPQRKKLIKLINKKLSEL